MTGTHETRLDLATIRSTPLDARTKGLPLDAGAVSVAEIGARGWRLLGGDLPFPQAVLRRSALDHNAAWMRDFVTAKGALLAPHGKTTMAPQLFDLQLAAGAWAITVATPQQFEVCRSAGVRRILMANQIIDPAGLRAVLRALGSDPELEFCCLVDSVAGAQRLAAAVRDHGFERPLRVLLELGLPQRRTGCRTLEQAVAVARVVASSPQLSLIGVEGFEGLIGGGPADRDAAEVSAFMDRMAATAEACAREGLFGEDAVLLSAGGSAYFDIVANRLSAARLDRPFRVVLRSGCYLTHDSHFYDRLFDAVAERDATARRQGRLKPALEVWSMVQSCPEDGLAILTMGKRDVGHDVDLPVPILHFRPGSGRSPSPIPADCRITGLNDQHAYLRVPAGLDLQVGDLIGSGVSHPCTTFDKWQVLMVVDDDYRVVDAVRTFF